MNRIKVNGIKHLRGEYNMKRAMTPIDKQENYYKWRVPSDHGKTIINR